MLKQLLHAACVALLLLAAYAADEPAPVHDRRGERVLKDPIHYWKRPTATYRRGEPSVLVKLFSSRRPRLAKGK